MLLEKCIVIYTAFTMIVSVHDQRRKKRSAQCGYNVCLLTTPDYRTTDGHGDTIMLFVGCKQILECCFKCLYKCSNVICICSFSYQQQMICRKCTFALTRFFALKRETQKLSESIEFQQI